MHIFFTLYYSADGINQQIVILKIKIKLFFHVILVLCITYYSGNSQCTVQVVGLFVCSVVFKLSDDKNLLHPLTRD